MFKHTHAIWEFNSEHMATLAASLVLSAFRTNVAGSLLYGFGMCQCGTRDTPLMPLLHISESQIYALLLSEWRTKYDSAYSTPVVLTTMFTATEMDLLPNEVNHRSKPPRSTGSARSMSSASGLNYNARISSRMTNQSTCT